jgi:hypothetical protein
VPLTAATRDRLPAVTVEMLDDLALDWPEQADADLADWEPEDAELADWDPEDREDPASECAEAADREAGGREVLKAGYWDRARGDGDGFAAGGVADHLPPGPALAGLAAGAWAAGLDRISDDELVGVMRAARRLASWAAAMELAAIGDLWRRRMAEEEAGETGAACHANDEIAAALTLTGRAGDRVLDLAVALRRLPRTSQALAAGDIDLPRVLVIVDEVTGLDDEHAAAVEQFVADSAPGQTTGQLRAATRRAVMAADPSAARRRKERAQQDARVERWDEHAGTAALAGRDLPPASVLAADRNLTAVAKQLKAGGVPGTMDTLRAEAFLALLTGTSVGSLLPGDPSAPRESADTGGAAPAGPFDPATAANPARLTATANPTPGLGGAVNLTMPLATWLGLSDAPGNASGHGPLDASDSRDLAYALASRAGNRWCLTFTDARGSPVAHGCARAGPMIDRRRGDRPASRSRAGPGSQPRADPTGDRWTFTITLLPATACDHAWQTAAYQPSPALRHLVESRHGTCVFPGCRRPATQCDKDHTVPYDQGGKTCLCNLAPLCRRHHRTKQARGWELKQVSPGVLAWSTPSGRHYVA